MLHEGSRYILCFVWKGSRLHGWFWNSVLREAEDLCKSQGAVSLREDGWGGRPSTAFKVLPLYHHHHSNETASPSHSFFTLQISFPNKGDVFKKKKKKKEKKKKKKDQLENQRVRSVQTLFGSIILSIFQKVKHYIALLMTHSSL